MKALSFALTSVVLFVFCGSASGILLQDDFEGVTAVTMMGQAATKAYPASPPWTIMFDNAGQTNAQVWNNLNVSSPAEDAGANQYLALNHNQSLDDPVAWGSGYNPADTLNKLVQLDFDFWVEGDSLPQGQSGKRLLFTAFDGIEQWSGQPWHVQLRADGTVWNRGGNGSSVNTGLTFTADSWQHATILADMMAGTFDLTVAGNTAVDLPFVNGWDNDVGVLYFQSAGGSSGFTGAIDNVSFSVVPEPSGVALLASGLLGRLAYAWRKRK